MHVLGGSQLLIILFGLWGSLFLYCSIEDIRYKSIHSRDLMMLIILSIGYNCLFDSARSSILSVSKGGFFCDAFGFTYSICNVFHGVWVFNVFAIGGGGIGYN